MGAIWTAAGFFIGLNDLVESKKKADRNQDRADLEVLKKVMKN